MWNREKKKTREDVYSSLGIFATALLLVKHWSSTRETSKKNKEKGHPNALKQRKKKHTAHTHNTTETAKEKKPPPPKHQEKQNNVKFDQKDKHTEKRGGFRNADSVAGVARGFKAVCLSCMKAALRHQKTNRAFIFHRAVLHNPHWKKWRSFSPVTREDAKLQIYL